MLVKSPIRPHQAPQLARSTARPQTDGAQESIQWTISQGAQIMGTLVAMGTMQRLGFEGATRLDDWCNALLCLTVAFAPRMEVFFLVPLFSIFQHGDRSVETCLQREAAKVNVGVGELDAAKDRMEFIADLCMPYVSMFLYIKFAERLPQAPFLAAIVIHVLAAEVMRPWATRRLSPAALAA